jgi:hypothetical protein
MQIVIDDAAARANSRVTGIRLAILLTRCMEIWRLQKHDADNVMIILAVVAITSEKLVRAGLADEHRTLESFLPLDELQGCNVSSIAAATAINRETVRRRVRNLIKAGSLIRTEAGEIALPPEKVQEPAALALIRKQLEAVTRFVNDSMRDGVLVADNRQRSD